MKEICKKIAGVLKTIFGYGVMISLFVGGLTFFGYLAALFIGGETATEICAFLYNTVISAVIKVSTAMVLLGLLAMYLSGEVALTPGKKPQKK